MPKTDRWSQLVWDGFLTINEARALRQLPILEAAAQSGRPPSKLGRLLAWWRAL